MVINKEGGKMQHQIVVPTGYMGSGSSAVTDLLSEVEGYTSTNGNYEYVFMHCPNGVFDLEDKLLIGNNVVRSDEALHSFYYCMETLCKNKHYWVGDYNNKIGEEFFEWCNDFINSLIDDKIQEAYWYYQENPDFRIFIKKVISKLLKVASHNKIKTKPGVRYEEMWISYVSEENFYKCVKTFLEQFFNKMGIKDNNIILDQFLLPHNLFRMDRYFDDNCKVIVVERDPRDVFLLNKYYWNKANCPVPYSFNVEKFCRNYKKMRLSEKTLDNKNVKRICFEDLIYNYDKEVKSLFDFLGISKEMHIRPGTKLIPEKSRINTQLFLKNNMFIEEAHYIENQLKEYIYDFPYIEKEKITDNNLIL